MPITVVAQIPALKATTLTAWLDLPGKVSVAADFKAHPAARDLARRRGKEGLKAAYLAAGAPPLLYLPAESAKHWDAADQARILGARAFEAALDRQAARLVIPLTGEGSAVAAPRVAEGIAINAYRFAKYKPSATLKNEPEVLIVVPKAQLAEIKQAVARRLEVAECINAARDMVNEPGSVMTPAEVEALARAVAKAHSLRITVLQEDQLKKEGYNGLLTVGRGGDVPPRMIILSYAPPKVSATKHLGLLGKGVTFDTGGYSIKPAGGMWQMKGDMAGAAAVLNAIAAIARGKVPLRVTAIIVTAQNMVDEDAAVPGDIFIAKNGKTVHIDNTDAEGRLILSDGLARMGEEGATDIVDVATLTGACARALGPALSGAFGAGPLLQEILAVAAEQGEPCWPMPLVEEYTEWLKFEIADINNVTTKPEAGATTAALFLREFVPPDTDWVHLDIAGTFLHDTPRKYYRHGATGIMVRTLTALAERLSTS